MERRCTDEHICHDRFRYQICSGTLIIDYRFHPSFGWKRFWMCDTCGIEYKEEEIVAMLIEELEGKEDCSMDREIEEYDYQMEYSS